MRVLGRNRNSMDNRLAELERLYREAGPGLLRYLDRRLHRRDEAEDVLQSTFVEAARFHDRLSAADSPRAWLYAVARNLVAARQRKAGLIAWSSLPPDPAAFVDSDSDERLDAMRTAIAGLPGALRETLELRVSQDLSYQEIASVLNVPIGTVRSRLHNAIEQLRGRLTCRAKE